jgi:hypothetical protein
MLALKGFRPCTPGLFLDQRALKMQRPRREVVSPRPLVICYPILRLLLLFLYDSKDIGGIVEVLRILPYLLVLEQILLRARVILLVEVI